MEQTLQKVYAAMKMMSSYIQPITPLWIKKKLNLYKAYMCPPLCSSCVSLNCLKFHFENERINCLRRIQGLRLADFRNDKLYKMSNITPLGKIA